jgi:hypothetical protein
MQNIGGENAGDAFYRYKMPKLVAKVGGLCCVRACARESTTEEKALGVMLEP